ncbi:MAG: TIGR00366 family protein [Bacteroidota bacterium]|nr:TIGR00366 family protein [Bacteroidota bacterium]
MSAASDSAPQRDRFAWVPSPLAIALGLTAVTAVAACVVGADVETVAMSWRDGLWNRPLLVFAFQAAFMLVLGHALALSRTVDRGVQRAVNLAGTTNARAAAVVTVVACVAGWINWGLGLIVGAVLARKVGERATERGLPLHYGLIGAAGYSGLMVWHGGLSGSAPIKVAEAGHLADLAAIAGIDPVLLPATLPLGLTVFSAQNLLTTAALIAAVAGTAAFLGRSLDRQSATGPALPPPVAPATQERIAPLLRVLPALFGTILLALAVRSAATHPDAARLGFIDPDWTNQTLLGLAFLLHGSLKRFLASIDAAIGGTSGILIQFPLYFGIMGIMSGTGLVEALSMAMVRLSTPATFELWTLLSAGIVNVFVPSGGGQWAVQGPLLLRAALDLGVPLDRTVLAMAYGDELTNMLQPFWALPLLGITGLAAKDILPYTLRFMAAGAATCVLLTLLF